jgi:CHAD domain-containing protein
VKAKPEESIRIYSAGLLLSQLDILLVEVAGVRASEDIEAIHKTRVSSRRMRAILDVFQDCLPPKRGILWLQQVKKLTGALGAARDTDVQIVTVNSIMRDINDPVLRPGFRRLQLRLKQRREKLQIRVLSRLDEFESSGVTEEIHEASQGLVSRNMDVNLYTPMLYRRSFDRIRESFDIFNSYEDRILDPANIDDLHAMRIAGKKLRYTMECFAPLYSHELKLHIGVMKTAQELLGSIHDCDVWIIGLRRFLDNERKMTIKYFGRDRYAGRFDPGIIYFLDNRKHERETLYSSFLENWNHWKSEKVWDNLFQLLQVPFFSEKGIMPLAFIEQIKNGGAQ